MTLSDQQRKEAWDAVAAVMQDAPNRMPRPRLRVKLMQAGWEVILINLVLPILLRIITEWLENKRTLSPTEMPADFLIDADDSKPAGYIES